MSEWIYFNLIVRQHLGRQDCYSEGCPFRGRTRRVWIVVLGFGMRPGTHRVNRGQRPMKAPVRAVLFKLRGETYSWIVKLMSWVKTSVKGSEMEYNRKQSLRGVIRFHEAVTPFASGVCSQPGREMCFPSQSQSVTSAHHQGCQSTGHACLSSQNVPGRRTAPGRIVTCSLLRGEQSSHGSRSPCRAPGTPARWGKS